MNRADPPAFRPSAGFACLAWKTSGADPAFDEVFALEVALDSENVRRVDATTRTWIVAPDRSSQADLDAAARSEGPSEGTGVVDPNEILEFLGPRLVLCADPRASRAWWMRVFGPGAPSPVWIHLAAVRALLFPGSEEVPPGWAGALVPPVPDLNSLSAGALREVFGGWLARHRERSLELRRFVLAALRRVSQVARSTSQPAADLLEALAERLSQIGSQEVEFPTERLPLPTALYARVEPAFAAGLDALLEEPPLTRQRGPHEIVTEPAEGAEVNALLERVFRSALPRSLTTPDAAAAPHLFRPGQLELALRIARANQALEFLLVDAPTGTGKTLAYAVPALLFSVRAEVRVGISTYTRTLQDQAYYREFPRAQSLLQAEGWNGSARIALLKGRMNYVCARVLSSIAPDADEVLEEQLAWMILALFALTDPLGDFDRLPRHAPIHLADSHAYETALARFKSEAAAEPLCCRRRSERARCAAHIARKRAERAHIVVTNHAFVLNDPGFFAHLIFDECDHLHRQTASSVSREVASRQLRREARRLTARTGLLERLAALFPVSSLELYADPVATALQSARTSAGELEIELEAFDERVRAFLLWRQAREAERARSEHHELLREYTSQELGEPLIATQRRLLEVFASFSTRLATLHDELASENGRGVARHRTRLARSLTDLGAVAADLSAWLPAGDGAPRFDPAYFHDVESSDDGSWKLVQRILLPQVYLGRHLFPRLGHAILLSASTWLRGGFDVMKAYLGLAALEAAQADAVPEKGEAPIEARRIATFRAPSSFDYQRAALVVPDDAPPYLSSGFGKQRFLDYVVRYLSFLGERSRGRLLGLFTNTQDLENCARRLASFFRARSIDLYWQGMPGRSKEELAELFRSRPTSVLLGLDTFWYGVDFAGPTLEQVVLVKLPYGPIDRFHRAQSHTLGPDLHRRVVYLPHAAAMFRQGFGRLLRRSDDRGAVHVLDRRILDARHRFFLQELPGYEQTGSSRPHLFVGASGTCIERALDQAGRLEEVRALGLDFEWRSPGGQASGVAD